MIREEFIVLVLLIFLNGFKDFHDLSSMGIDIQDIEIFKARIPVKDVYAKITELKVDNNGNDMYEILFVLKYIKLGEVLYTETFKCKTDKGAMEYNVFKVAYTALKSEFDKRGVSYQDNV